MIIKLFFPPLQRYSSFFYLFHVSLGLFLVELLLNDYKIVLSSALKLYFALPFVSRLMRSISCRTVANYYKIVLSSALKLCFLLPFVSRLMRSISCRTLALFFLKLFFPLLQRFISFFHLFEVSFGLFLVELLLYYYKIVLSPALKLYFFLPFVSRLMRSFSCRTVAKLL